MNQWQFMISELRSKGVTQTEIAKQMGCSQNYVSNLEKGLCGKRLSYEFGKKLSKLWKKHCNSKLTA